MLSRVSDAQAYGCIQPRRSQQSFSTQGATKPRALPWFFVHTAALGRSALSNPNCSSSCRKRGQRTCKPCCRGLLHLRSKARRGYRRKRRRTVLDWSRRKLTPVSSYSFVSGRCHNVRNSTLSRGARTGEAHLSMAIEALTAQILCGRWRTPPSAARVIRRAGMLRSVAQASSAHEDNHGFLSDGAV